MKFASGLDELERAEEYLAHRDPRALSAFNLAETCGADADRCAAGRWMAHMLGGNFRSAWKESDAIFKRGTEDPHRLWDGRPLDGRRVIVRCLHGLGDAVQFLRYAPRLRAIAAWLKFEVPPALMDLARCFSAVEQVGTWDGSAPTGEADWETQIEVMELPYYFRTGIEDLPIATNYLRLPEMERQRFSAAMRRTPDRMRVGLVWAAGDWNPSRSVPLSALSPLLEESGYEFWNLQGGCARGEWRGISSSCPLRDATEFGDGVSALAYAIAQMDLVITVDTLAAHLAGAMGKPAWVLLQHAADWRWMMAGERSPWYPTVRLFRQPSQGNWAAVVQGVRRELLQRTSHMRGAARS